MLYFDYTWDLSPAKIIFDNELNTDKLGWKGGDYFKFTNIDGKQMLVKVDAVEKFLIDGSLNNKEK
jgi:hypothetical protein